MDASVTAAFRAHGLTRSSPMQMAIHAISMNRLMNPSAAVTALIHLGNCNWFAVIGLTPAAATALKMPLMPLQISPSDAITIPITATTVSAVGRGGSKEGGWYGTPCG